MRASLRSQVQQEVSVSCGPRAHSIAGFSGRASIPASALLQSRRAAKAAPRFVHEPSVKTSLRVQQARCSAVTCYAIADPSSDMPAVLVNSCTGKMGQAVGEAALRAGLELVPYTLCGPAEAAVHTSINVGGVEVELVGPNRRDAVLERLHERYGKRLIAVDYTLPACVEQQVEFYVRSRTPFVMGTTGGNRERMAKTVEDAGLFSVIAPNMGKQIVAFQATMEMMATTYPGCFSGYKMRVVESHQSSKMDTSGTAKAIVKSFQGLGIKFDEDQIELVRTRDEQLGRMKVPESALLGHAFHTYQLVSPDGTVSFEFQHNVVGRTVYAEGTVDAVLFLARQIQSPPANKKTLFNMVDVLRAGIMR